MKYSFLISFLVGCTVVISGCNLPSGPSVLREDCATSIYVVNTTADDLPADSFCALGAECSLRVAINNANHCRTRGPQTIRLAEDSTYILTTEDTDPGYLGGEWARMNAAFGDVTLPYIMGDVTISGLRTTLVKRNVDSTLFHVAPGATLRLSGMSLSGDTDERTPKGGAIYNQGELFLNISASGFRARQGGVIYNSGRASIAGNYSDNRADDGGVVYNSGSLSYDGGELLNNAAQLGGAIHNSGGAQIKDALFVGNSANGVEAYNGTGIFSNGRSLNVLESVFSDHQDKPIIVGRDDARIHIKGSSFIENGNERQIANGLIANLGGSTQITSSTITNNTGRNSIVNCTGTPASVTILRDSTISHNNIVQGFGGAFIVAGASSNPCRVQVSNSVIANTSGGPNCAIVAGALLENSVSADDDESCGFSVTVDDARLGPLDSTYPTLLTSGRKPLPDSPLINAGTDCEVRDQARQRRRIVTPSGESACDIGALEVR